MGEPVGPAQARHVGRMIFLLIAVLLVGGCGIVPNGYGGYCTEGVNCEQQRERMRSLAPVLVVPAPAGSQPGVFDYATGRKPTCTNPTGYGVGC